MKIEVGKYTLHSDSMCMWVTEEVETKDRKTENSSEKPNNSTISKMEQVETMSCQECKHFNENAVMYLDQCEFCFKECHYEPKDEPTISKMEQVDKDINVRSKDEPQTERSE